MNKKLKAIILVAAVVLLGASFIPMWDDPYHEKEEPVILWEWLYKEVWELIYGKKETGGES